MSVAALSATDAVGLAVNLVYGALAVGILLGVFLLAKYLYGLYKAFTTPGGKIEEQIANMFTPHQDDGSIAPKDVKPKNVDSIDWIFMNHDLSEPI
jgi:hypothetical protein